MQRTTPFGTFAFGADSRRVAAIADFEGLSNSGESVHLLQLPPEHAQQKELIQCLGSAYRAAISPDHQWAATQEPNGVRLWHLVDDLASFRMKIPGLPSRMSFSPDSRRLFVSSREDGVYLCDLTAKGGSKQVLALGQHPNIRHFDASSDGRWLVTTSFGLGLTKPWDLTTEPASSIVILAEPTGGTAVNPCISPNSRWLAFVDPELRLMDLTAPSPVSSTLHIRGNHQRPVISPDSRWLAAVRDGRVVCYELPRDATSTTKVIMTAPDVEPTWMNFSRNSRWLVTGSYDRAAHMWDLQADDPAATETGFAGHNGIVKHSNAQSKWTVADYRR